MFVGSKCSSSDSAGPFVIQMAEPKRRRVEDVRFRIHRTSTLGWNGDVEAKALMAEAERRANMLLKAHGWAVMHMAEFYPRSQNLLGLNVNKGEKIQIRFRRADNKNVFLPFEEIMCTVVHELVHNTISPHNAAFDALNRKLIAECEQNEIAEVGGLFGAVGGGGGKDDQRPFAGKGHRLGGDTSFDRNESPEERRVRMLTAAVVRLSLQDISDRLFPSTGGGDGDEGCCSQQQLDSDEVAQPEELQELKKCPRCTYLNAATSTRCSMCDCPFSNGPAASSSSGPSGISRDDAINIDDIGD